MVLTTHTSAEVKIKSIAILIPGLSWSVSLNFHYWYSAYVGFNRETNGLRWKIKLPKYGFR